MLRVLSVPPPLRVSGGYSTRTRTCRGGRTSLGKSAKVAPSESEEVATAWVATERWWGATRSGARCFWSACTLSGSW